MSITSNYKTIKASIPKDVTLVVVTKKHNLTAIKEVYNAGARIFGENKVQELLEKQPFMPSDVEWHLIGHLQSNKVKYIAPFVSLIQSVDSLKLLVEINKQALANKRTIACLLQLHIAEEETKFGLSLQEAKEILTSEAVKSLTNITIIGIMGMATNTEDKTQITKEFKMLADFFHAQRSIQTANIKLETLSMGMSSDYMLAIANGSNLIRVGSSIFGSRT
jgi:PLP dependent protein